MQSYRGVLKKAFIKIRKIQKKTPVTESPF